MESNYQTFANDIKLPSIPYLIEEFGTYLIRSKAKTAFLQFALSKLTCLSFDAFNYKIRLYQCLVLTATYLLYPLFSLEKKGILISCQSRSVVRPSVCPSVRPCVRPSVTFLVNVSPPKPLEIATSNFVGE